MPAKLLNHANQAIKQLPLKDNQPLAILYSGGKEVKIVALSFI